MTTALFWAPYKDVLSLEGFSQILGGHCQEHMGQNSNVGYVSIGHSLKSLLCKVPWLYQVLHYLQDCNGSYYGCSLVPFLITISSLRSCNFKKCICPGNSILDVAFPFSFIAIVSDTHVMSRPRGRREVLRLTLPSSATGWQVDMGMIHKSKASGFSSVNFKA